MKTTTSILAALICATPLLADWKVAQEIVTQGSQNARFGYSIAVSDNYAAVGAPEENGGAGAVYIFKQDANNTWSPFQTIENVTISDENSNFVWYDFESLGWDVALAESRLLTTSATLVIGAPQSRRAHQIITMQGPDNEYTPESGILIYRLNGEGSAFEYAKDYRGDDHNDTGLAVDVAEAQVIVGYNQSGELRIPILGTLTTVVAGHPNDDNVSTYINKLGTEEWREIVLSHATEGDHFGESLAIDSDMSHLIIGAPYRDIEEYPDKGSAYLYKLSGTWQDDDLAWGSEEVISQSTSGILLYNCRFSHESHFGIAADLKYDNAIVGSEKSSTECRPTAFASYQANGAAYLYALTDGTDNSWSQSGYLFGSSVNSQSDGFGLSVAVTSARAIVGAPTYYDSKQTGAAFIYDYNGSVWSETQAIIPGTDGTFGNDVAMYVNQIFSADEENDWLDVFEYEEPVTSSINPALLMYMLH